ncbi:MAG: hypothetical protein ACRC6O_01280 [Flavobacterium sp.]
MKKMMSIMSLLLLLGCGSNTVIVNSWSDPNKTIYQENFKKVLVVVLVKDEATRRTTENEIVAMDPTVFVTSNQYLNESTQNLTNDQKLKILKAENFDGVLTMRLVSTDKETNYVPGTNTSLYYGGFGGMYSGLYGYGFGNWYNMYSPFFYTPGYYQESTSYMVETNIFSLKDNRLIWTGTTKTTSDLDIAKTADSIMDTLYKQMIKDGTIPKPVKA